MAAAASGSASAGPEARSGALPAALLARERQCQRRNAELEAKTAELVRQAEAALRDQQETLARPIPAQLGRGEQGGEEAPRDLRSPELPTLPVAPNKQSNKKKPATASTARTRTQSGKKGIGTSLRYGSATSRPCTVPSAADVAVPDFSLAKTIGKIEGQLEEGNWPDMEEDVLFSGGNEIGTEAQIRFLKAKLRVMQEELDNLGREGSKKDEESRALSCQLKEAEEEHRRLQRTANGQQSQLEKYKLLAEEATQKGDRLQQQALAQEKELENLKRAQKQASASQSAMEVRLNRALEEAERAKQEVQKLKQSHKELVNQEHQKLEELKAENKRLEKQKGELLAAFKKQLKLIDILRRQKMHIEAAQMLSFTEEEFMKALEWGNP